DRYKVFIDLFNVSSFLIPRGFLPKLSDEMKVKLSVALMDGMNNTCYTKNNNQQSVESKVSATNNKTVSGLENGDHKDIDEKSNMMPNDLFKPTLDRK
ncbi:unnamed protein product, partial [Didymodactylos carnosus]